MHVELKDRHNCVMHGTGCCTWIYWQCTARYKDLLTVYSSVQRSIDSVLLGGKLHRQCTARYKDLLTVYCSVQRSIDSVLLGRNSIDSVLLGTKIY